MIESAEVFEMVEGMEKIVVLEMFVEVVVEMFEEVVVEMLVEMVQDVVIETLQATEKLKVNGQIVLTEKMVIEMIVSIGKKELVVFEKVVLIVEKLKSMDEIVAGENTE